MTEQTQRVVASAPGKVILFGEQCVVLGRIAIATALDLRTFVTVETCPSSNTVEIQIPDLSTEPRSFTLEQLKYDGSLPSIAEPSLDNELLAFIESITPSADRGIVALLFILLGISQKKLSFGLKIHIKSEFQPGVGLGSSAAYNVSLAAALLKLFGHISTTESNSCRQQEVESPSLEDARIINAWAFNAEKIMHGTPSGIDNSICTFGGAVTIKQGKINTIAKTPNLRLIITNTKVPRSTKALVAHVVALHKQYPNIVNPLLDCVENIGQSVLKAFEELHSETDEDKLRAFESDLCTYIDINQHVLCALGVGHRVLDEVIAIARDNGGFHTKLTGAGGGGCAYTLIGRGTDHAVVETLKQKLRDRGFDCFEAVTGVPGVVYHKI